MQVKGDAASGCAKSHTNYRLYISLPHRSTTINAISTKLDNIGGWPNVIILTYFQFHCPIGLTVGLGCGRVVGL